MSNKKALLIISIVLLIFFIAGFFTGFELSKKDFFKLGEQSMLDKFLTEEIK